jgi:uncharacterized OB-fold protein
MRPLPEITRENEHFWRGGETGKLVFLRCRACRTFVHPPAPICPQCLGRDLAGEAVSGEATVVACTVNHKAWAAGEDVPYAIAIVEMPEQAGLRLTTNIVGCAPEQVRIGLRVRVRFEARGDAWIPLFEIVGGGAR